MLSRATGSMEEVGAYKQGLNYYVAHQGSCTASSPGIPAASKNIFMDRRVRAPCVLRRKQSKGGCLSKG